MINLQNKNPKILVIGDLMIDHYLWGSSERISPEAPVPVVNIERENSVLGGGGNVVNNLSALGAKVDVISVIGDCEIADELKALLADIDISSEYLIVEKTRPTSKKTRVIAANQQVIRYDKESKNNILPPSEKSIVKTFSAIVSNYDIVLLSDYGKGMLTDDLTQSLISIATKNNKKVLIDPKGSDYSKYRGAYLLTPNKKEASEATGIDIIDEKSLKTAITQLKNQHQLAVSLITLSGQGVAVYDDKLTIYPTKAREVFDVTGAGDTVLSALGFALAAGYDIQQAVIFSNLAAGVVVGKIGSATTSIDEIIAYEFSLKNHQIDARIKSQSQMAQLVKNFKEQGRKIVFSNGCFDILHIGHIRYLSEAKNLGDVLIVGLNSDTSVRQLKGKNRPINTQQDRAYLLAALESVDFVVIFDEQTPYNLIKTIVPDVLVKGGDYQGKTVVGSDIATEVKLIKFVADKSTTNTIGKIKQL